MRYVKLFGPGIVMATAALLYLPPGEFALGGWDAGVYFNTAVSLANKGGFSEADPLLMAVGPAAQRLLVADGYLQPGFYWHSDSGGTVTQFPFMLAVWMAGAVLIAGPAAAFYVSGIVGLLAVAVFYLFARRLLGPLAALAAAALLAFNGLQVWHAKITLAEEMVQLFLFSGLWAGWIWQDDRRRWAAVAAGLMLGLLPLVKTEAALLGLLGCVAVGTRARWFWAPYLGSSLLAGVHYVAFARVSAAPQVAAVWPFVVAAGAAAVLLLVWRRRPRLLFAPGAAAGLVASTAIGPPDLSFLLALWNGLYLALVEIVPVAIGLVVARKTRALAILAVAAVFYVLLFHHYYGAREEIPLFMWAARRLVPVVLPLVILAEAAGLVWAVRRWVAPRWQTPVVAGVVVILIGLRAPDLAVLMEAREYHGALNAVALIAARVEPDAVLLLDGTDAGIRFAAPLRWVEGRASYLLRGDVPAEILGMDRPVYYLSDQDGGPALRGVTLHPRGGWRFQLPELERTSERRPAKWDPFTADLRLYRVTLAE